MRDAVLVDAPEIDHRVGQRAEVGVIPVVVVPESIQARQRQSAQPRRGRPEKSLKAARRGRQRCRAGG